MNDVLRLRPTHLAAGLLSLGWAGFAMGQSFGGYEGVVSAAKDLAANNATVQVRTIGTSRENRDLLLMTLSSDAAKADSKPALLITAGLDGRHGVGVQTALLVARQIVTDHADLLNDVTVYVIPCANPDGMQRNLGGVNFGHIGTLRAVDEDRDGAADEDAPTDLNGDGVINMMRRIDPPLDDTATHLPDPEAPRLLKKADKEKGERAIYSVYIEGLDADGDGLVAEDGPGSVDLDKNFMHRWPEHDVDSGPTQLSEPESAALAKFVLEHPNIVEAITFGRHDNLVNVPDGKGKDNSGEGPKDLDEDDVGYYNEVAKVFKELTGQENAPKPPAETAGSFHAWLYAQRGIPSFATVVWGRPEAPKEDEKKKKGGDAAESQPADSQPAATEPDRAGDDSAKPQAAEDAEAQAEPGAEDDVKSGGDKKKSKKDEKPKPADEEAAEWLKYSDRERGGAGFIEWTAFDHPTLGKVEIGGFVPGFQMNPKEDQLDDLAAKQTKFIVELIGRRPKLSVDGPTVKKLADGLYEVRLGIVNDGYLPTATAMARKAESLRPTVVRISTPIENIVAGERTSRVNGIGGSGERWTARWIVRADDGSDIAIAILNQQLGEQTITVKAE